MSDSQPKGIDNNNQLIFNEKTTPKTCSLNSKKSKIILFTISGILLVAILIIILVVTKKKIRIQQIIIQ